MELREGYKLTEVGVIPEDWDLSVIGSIAEIFGGGTPSTFVREYWDGEIPWVSAGDVSNADGRFIYETADSITELGLAYSPARILPMGTTIIIARGATVGRIAQLGNAMTFNQTCYGLLPRISLDKDYLYYSMLFSVPSIKALTFGTIFGTITTSTFQKWMIPVPPLPEQRAIATALGDVDALIASLDALIAKKRDIKQGAMQELLTGKKRLAGFGGEWEEKTLGQLTEKFVNGGTPSTIQLEFWNGDIPWITGADIEEQKISKIRRFITNEAVKNSSTNVVAKGNLLIVSRTGVGKLAIAPFDIAISQDFTGVYLKSNEVSTNFLFRYLDFNSENLKSLNQGTSIQGFTRDKLESVTINLPRIEEQDAIVAVLSDMDDEIAALEQKRAKYELLKQGMMQELLTGKTRLVATPA